MKIKNKGAAPRLQFTEVEMKEEALQKPISRVKQAEAARTKARKRLHQTVGSVDERFSHLHRAETVDANPAANKTSSAKHSYRHRSMEFVKGTAATSTAQKTGLKSVAPESIQSRFHAVSDLEAPRSRLKSSAAGQAIRNELHKQIEQDEADNTGLQAVHTLERSGETAVHTGLQLREVQTTHRLKQAVRAEEKVDRANIRFLQKQQEIQHPQTGSNPISRARQKRAIQKEYRMAKAGKSTGRTAASVRRKRRWTKVRKSLSPSFVKREHGCLRAWSLC